MDGDASTQATLLEGVWYRNDSLHAVKGILVSIELIWKLAQRFLELYLYVGENKRPMGLDALLENQHGYWPKFRSCTYTLFLSQGVEIELILALMVISSWDTGRFSKLSLFLLYGQQFSRYGHIWAWNLAKVLKVAHIPFFYPRGSKLSLLSHYKQQFPRYGRALSKLPYLGMKLGQWPSDRSCTYTLSLFQGIKIEFIFILWAAVSEIVADFQNCHIWAWNLHALPFVTIPEVAHILSFPQGLKIELILTLRTADS